MILTRPHPSHSISPRRASAAAFTLIAAFLLAAASPLLAQHEPPANGPRPNPVRVHALMNARVIVSPGVIIEHGDIIIRDGLIEAVGPDLTPPDDARVWDFTGHTIHAGFIDASVPIASPASLPPSPGLHWNSHVRAQVRAAELGSLDSSTAETLRSIGFTAANLIPDRGVFRGSSALVSLSEDLGESVIYLADGPQVIHFETGGWGSDEYPSVLIGAIALIRQTFYDAAWHADCVDQFAARPAGLEAPPQADALDALRAVIRPGAGATHLPHPVLIDTDSELDLTRAARLRDEFNLNILARGSGNEYRRLSDVVAARLPLILTINFPKAPKVESLDDADSLSLRDMMSWEQAPTNPRRLINAGLTIALSTDSLRDRSDFLANLRRAIDDGLTDDQALAALTTTPASILGVAHNLGTLDAGAIADLVVIDGDSKSIFDKDRTVTDLWIDGDHVFIKPPPVVNAIGTWSLKFTAGPAPAPPDAPADVAFSLAVSGKPDKPSVTFRVGDKKESPKSVALSIDRLSFILPGKVLGRTGWEHLSAVIEGDLMTGQGAAADGTRYTWTATRTSTTDPDDDEREKAKAAAAAAAATQPATQPESPTTQPATAASTQPAADADKKEGEEEKKPEPAPENYPTPLGPFGLWEPRARTNHVFINDAVVWTLGPAGTIEKGDILFTDGRVEAVGPSLTPPPDALVIEAAGKHVTPGLIDCHSHTGIDRGSINEGAHAVSAETRIQDAIDPDDLNWYRELAGGLTAVNQLHGSANPIGGQNSVVKIRWGDSESAFRFAGAIPGIKFALGENVKQSNWGDGYTTRYPQTRMGVEQLIRSSFQSAKDYAADRARYDAMSPTDRTRRYPPRRDLQLDALAEILAGVRLVHCHSYRQDEILMLIHVADDFGFTIGTFQHILEGFKVAAEIADHGAGASSFSDWWAYKIEVYDAIPYNGAILYNVGVNVTFNSDSDELARRLNTEAAKAVRYGHVPPDEALKFVSLNAARQLRIDDRVGSIEPGKDADFVIWSGDPLSTYTICEQTWIDGRCMFSLESDLAAREKAKSERQRLLQKILRVNLEDPDKVEDKKSDSPDTQPQTAPADPPPPSTRRRLSIGQQLTLQGHDPALHAQGLCACLLPPPPSTSAPLPMPAQPSPANPADNRDQQP